ncbi:FGGY-family carbohydrate kinase [Chitinimonas koreensis]|uniref:FGGY-family carbohydrate kinase n=1 Tax=Chitinimonas koreensis TaxID=356302 RepID=UPI00040E0DCA|nr:FGGY-family carbohydrate kinase [Chitinimonas koreensis]QNM97842.1 FGGY-family carbohydrate kinase [Chitinimonas koreensis]
MSNDYLLAIDNGTQSVRALLFDLHGHLVDKAQVSIDYADNQPGWVENDPEAFWQSLCQVCQRLWANTPVPKSAVRGVVITTQRGTVVNLDRDGNPLRPAILWLDQRRARKLPQLPWWWRTAFRAIGMRDTVEHFLHEAEANWIAQEQPEIWDRTHKYLLLSGYLNYRFTGRYVDSTGSQVGYVPFDYKHGRWAAGHDWKWQALPIRPDMLPELVAPGTVIGEVGREVSEATGIPMGLPVIAGAADKACEVLGAGCLSPEVACLSFGTAATINTTTRRYVEATPFVPPYQAAVPGHYNTEVQITRGFWMVSWFKEQFGLHEQQEAAALGVSPESLFDALVEAVPPGAQGLMLQPFWNPGIKVPGPEARGAVIGFSDVHTRAHLYRAILEGLVYALREAGERIERRSGTAIETVRVSGGGSQSDAAMQITADIFGRPSERPHLYETSGLGAAIIGSVGLGLHGDYRAALADMTRVGRRFEPQPEHAARYRRLYREVYCGMYERLRPLYQSLREIDAAG